jgi:hypothetical protein
MQVELKKFDEQSITFAKLTQVQDQLLALAREHGCTLKKASPRAKGKVDFVPNANLTEKESSKDAQDEFKAEFELHQCGLALSVAGELAQILSFMRAVREQTWIASADQLFLRREASSGGNMSLELDLNFWSLQKKRSGEFGETQPPKA